MNKIVSQSLGRVLVLAALTVLAACADEGPSAPENLTLPQFASVPEATKAQAIATLRRVTARYHNLNAAIEDGFGLLHPCENRPGEGPVGAVFVHMGRLLDGKIDPESPDGLIYAPRENGRLRLVGVEFAIPNAMWPEQEPPEFLGNPFQAEDEFGVWALHAWVWSENPDGMFAESNPRVSCGAE